MSEKFQKEINAIYEISKVLGSSPDIKVTLRSALVILSNFFKISKGIVAVKGDEEVEIISSYGLTREEEKRGKYKLGEGVIGRVAKNGIPIVIPDIKSEAIFLNRTKSRKIEDNTKIAFICVPIKIKNQILGVIGIDKYSEENRKFEDDLRLLKIVAGLFAINIKLNSFYEAEKFSLIQERDLLKNQLKERYSLKNVIGESEKMQVVFETVHQVAKTKASILLLGESGTGKELIAKSIHYLSDRSDKPFVRVNCSAIPEGLMESELFGHEKGAFTGAVSARKGRFELANGGTIFLDEIGDLPLSLQPKLLRVIQEMEFEKVGGEKTIKVDVRIISATNRNLERLVQEGKFREDLYFRLNVIPIIIPPLREREGDIPILIDFFTEKFNKLHGKNVRINDRALNFLINYNWPGNVRELENTIERLVLMSKDDIVDVENLPLNIREFKRTFERDVENISLPEKGLPEFFEIIEKEYIIKALSLTKGNRKQAGKLLGLTERQINYKIQKYNIN
ncbi:MAG: nif-specific transcriptional activator NifA [Proteobacteria bacterium]|nr:nif-specific transcriptional activator NifA [Pseudomonadota bacterium]